MNMNLQQLKNLKNRRWQAVLLAALVLSSLLLFVAPVFAAEIRLESQKVNVKTAEQFIVDVFVSSDESLNAIEGKLSFTEKLLSLREIREGSSVINFWIEKPRREEGEIVFSGITPGGFKGPQNLLFSLVFEAESAGEADILLLEAAALRNDGLGTSESLSLRNAEISVKPGDSKIRSVSPEDEEQPEDFVPIITSDPQLFEGKQVLVFATQDKGSGVLGYEVKEFRYGLLSLISPWERAESPYVLKDQELKSRIEVRVIDFSGNKRVVLVAPQYALTWYDHLRAFAILSAALLFGFFIFKVTTAWKGK